MHTHVTNTYAQLHAHEHSHIHAQNTHTDLWTHTLFPTSDSITLSMWGCSLLLFSPHNNHEFFPRRSAFLQSCHSSPDGHVVVLRFLCHTCKAWPGLRIRNFNYSPRFVPVWIPADGGGLSLHFIMGVDEPWALPTQSLRNALSLF